MEWDDLMKTLSETQEGSAKFLSFPLSKRINKENDELVIITPAKDMPVFYNPQMVINRDFSILFTEAYKKKYFPNQNVSFFDIMAASGIRSIRMALEMPDLRIVMNDLNPMALRLIRKNMELNGLIEQKGKIELVQKEANRFLFEKSVERDYGTIIDVDPFGTPNLFVENSIKALQRGGLLCVTATDTAVLFGVKRNACIRKYGIESLKNGFFKEIGMRILITFIAQFAHMHDLYIIPQFSLSQEHFIRIFMSFGKSEGEIKKNLDEFGFIVSCDECFYYESVKGSNSKLMDLPRNCPVCNTRLKIVGPIWLGRLHDPQICVEMQQLLETKDKSRFPLLDTVKKIATLAPIEDSIGIGYYNIHQICDKFKLNILKYSSLKSQIEERGYHFTRTFIDDKCIRTDMPANELIEILKRSNMEQK